MYVCLSGECSFFLVSTNFKFHSHDIVMWNSLTAFRSLLPLLYSCHKSHDFVSVVQKCSSAQVNRVFLILLNAERMCMCVQSKEFDHGQLILLIHLHFSIHISFVLRFLHTSNNIVYVSCQKYVWNARELIVFLFCFVLCFDCLSFTIS